MAAAAGCCSSCSFVQCRGSCNDLDFFISDPGGKKTTDPGSAFNYFLPVLRVRDVSSGSGFFFSSRIQDQKDSGSRINLSIFTQKLVSNFRK
jgi:hypothetical protein